MADRTFVIAEAGVNHNGSLELALRLIDVAAEAGADAVKFQTFKAENVATASAIKAEYQLANTQRSESQLDMLRRLELPAAGFQALSRHCRQRGIRFMSTPFDAQSLELVAGLDMPAIKIASGDITCGPLLLQAARLRRPLIVSTGMSNLAEIEAALGVIAFGLTCNDEPTSPDDFDVAYRSRDGRLAVEQQVTLLHCVTQYPAPPESIHLRAMDTMAAAFGLPVGYSDHTSGIEVALAAVARGASVIEKHFTLDRSLPGPDHAASLEPEQLALLIRSVRNVELSLGSTTKAAAPQEVSNRSIARRSVVAARVISKGEPLAADMLTFKRPGSGVSPMDFWGLIGRPARHDFAVDDLIEP